MVSMKRMTVSLLLMGLGSIAFGQEAAPGWHRFGEQVQNPGDGGGASQDPRAAQDPRASQDQGVPPRADAQRQYPPPSSLTVPAGTWITVRMNQALSSDRNQSGDAFTAELAEPIVAQGLVVARRGQTIGGRVSEAAKAGYVKGTSKLGVELTELSLADGQQMPIKTQFIERRGNTSVGRDVGAVGATTGLGAIIGGAAGGGLGAGIGAAAGAVLGTGGVLATRGQPTIIFPESVLTFRLEQPLTIASQAMQAFQPVGQEEYGRPTMMRSNAQPQSSPVYRAPYPPAVYPYYPYYPSGGFSLFIGPGFGYGRGYYGGRGFYGRGRW